jgi:hypothetical protein
MLSICIPTYKREEYLLQNLNKIVDNASRYNMEIVICDNDPAGNGLKDKLLEFHYPNILYIKNNENIGIDRNMIKTAEIARGNYCLWLGDDDILNNNSLDEINKVINNNDYDLILLNTNWISEDLSSTGEVWKYNEDRELNDINEFFRKHVYDMPFGAIIIKNEFLTKINIKKYLGTSHAYSGYIIEYLNYINQERKIKVLISNNIKVYLRDCVKSWSKNSFKIHYEEIPRWFDLLPNGLDDKNVISSNYIKNLFSKSNIIRNINWIDEINNYDLVYEISIVIKLKILFIKIVYPIYKKIFK